METKSESESAPTESKKTIGKEQPYKFLVDAVVIQQIKKPRTYMNHSYRDFSNVPAPLASPETPSDITQMTFPQKVHHILSDDRYAKWIGWQPHGRAFCVHLPLEFERHVSERYFGHKRYSSFLRQLSNHGFKHITTGRDRNCYYHELMLRGLPYLCVLFPAPKDSRRLIPDPENEPNFYDISQRYPLPCYGTSSADHATETSRIRVASEVFSDEHPSKRRMIAGVVAAVPRPLATRPAISRLDSVVATPLESTPLSHTAQDSGLNVLERLLQARVQAEQECQAIEKQLLRESAVLAALLRSRSV